YNGSGLEKDRKETREFVNKLEQELKRIEQEETSFSIKKFLLEKSYLVQFQKKEAAGRSLSKAEQAKEKRIYDLRDKVFANMQKELARYYQAVIQGNYHLDGFPEISGGIKA
ncbi:7948_t:CDS:1, partial [Paraglomus occultum]